jgi:predicted HicB family RNase H-like nuclease
MNDFKPIKNEKCVISIRIDVKTLETIDNQANEANISRNEMIVQCVEYALKNLVAGEDQSTDSLPSKN